MKANGNRNPRDAKEIRRAMNKNVIGYMKEVRALYKSNVRQANYEFMQAAAHMILYYQEKPGQYRHLMKEKMFQEMHQKPTGGAAVMQFLLEAGTKVSRERANEQGRVIDLLLKEGKKPEQIAEQLSTRGGVSGILEEQRALTTETEDGSEGDADDADDEEENDDSGNTGEAKRSSPRASGPAAPSGYKKLELLVPSSRWDEILDLGSFKAKFRVQEDSATGWKLIFLSTLSRSST